MTWDQHIILESPYEPWELEGSSTSQLVSGNVTVEKPNISTSLGNLLGLIIPFYQSFDPVPSQ